MSEPMRRVYEVVASRNYLTMRETVVRITVSELQARLWAPLGVDAERMMGWYSHRIAQRAVQHRTLPVLDPVRVPTLRSEK